MTCASCGATVQEGSKFCMECGTPVAATAAGQPPPPPPDPAATPPPPPPPPMSTAPLIDPAPLVSEDPVAPGADAPPPPPVDAPPPPAPPIEAPAPIDAPSPPMAPPPPIDGPPPPPIGAAALLASPPPPPPAPVAAPPPQPSPQDPHAMGQAAGRLGNAAKKSGRTALGLASVLLEPGELVECLVVGKVHELDGACLLTDRRVYVLNDRVWLPDQVSFPLDASLFVQGEAAGKSANLTLHRAGVMVQVAKIADVALAQELAQRIRARVAAPG